MTAYNTFLWWCEVISPWPLYERDLGSQVKVSHLHCVVYTPYSRCTNGTHELLEHSGVLCTTATEAAHANVIKHQQRLAPKALAQPSLMALEGEILLRAEHSKSIIKDQCSLIAILETETYSCSGPCAPNHSMSRVLCEKKHTQWLWFKGPHLLAGCLSTRKKRSGVWYLLPLSCHYESWRDRGRVCRCAWRMPWLSRGAVWLCCAFNCVTFHLITFNGEASVILFRADTEDDKRAGMCWFSDLLQTNWESSCLSVFFFLFVFFCWFTWTSARLHCLVNFSS